MRTWHTTTTTATCRQKQRAQRCARPFFFLFFCTGSKWGGLYPPPPLHIPYPWTPSPTTAGTKVCPPLFLLLFFCTEATSSKRGGLYPPPSQHIPYRRHLQLRVHGVITMCRRAQRCACTFFLLCIDMTGSKRGGYNPLLPLHIPYLWTLLATTHTQHTTTTTALHSCLADAPSATFHLVMTKHNAITTSSIVSAPTDNEDSRLGAKGVRHVFILYLSVLTRDSELRIYPSDLYCGTGVAVVVVRLRVLRNEAECLKQEVY